MVATRNFASRIPTRAVRRCEIYLSGVVSQLMVGSSEVSATSSVHKNKLTLNLPRQYGLVGQNSSERHGGVNILSNQELE